LEEERQTSLAIEYAAKRKSFTTGDDDVANEYQKYRISDLVAYVAPKVSSGNSSATVYTTVAGAFSFGS
jgi:hypothetical protein